MGPRTVAPRRVGLALFFPPPAQNYTLCVLSGATPSGWSMTQRTPNVHFGGPRHFKHHRNSHKECHFRREEEQKAVQGVQGWVSVEGGSCGGASAQRVSVEMWRNGK